MTSLEADIASRADMALNVLLRSKDAQHIGERISQLEHALQTAHLAKNPPLRTRCDRSFVSRYWSSHRSGCPQMDGLGTIEHETRGAEYLASLGFGRNVQDLVSAHVDAKRYLCYRKLNYFDGLSEASRGTLAYQGGPMDHDEACLFESRHDFGHILALRIFDERAKVVDAKVPSLDAYREMIETHLRSQEGV